MTWLWIFLAVVVLAIIAALIKVIVQYQRDNQALTTEVDDQEKKHAEEAKKWHADSSRLMEAIRRLAKYKGIVDAEAKAAEILQKAHADAERSHHNANEIVSDALGKAASIKSQAEEVLDSANAKAANCIEESGKRAAEIRALAEEAASLEKGAARQNAKEMRERCKALLDSATVQSTRIIERANKRAEEIGGSAYAAMKNAALHEQTVKAMKNIIEGYGNQYLVPSQSILDELALAFGHTQAGQELKNAREQSKRMVQNGTAATCDYVEAGRQETAINFATDAFNGKVDSILSRVRQDNAGTLEQEIRDAFTLVNFNGKAFRNARIADDYLASRLDELKWGALVQQQKMDEREEQRRIKEEIREEAKARKEYERAMRESAQQEEMLRKAMEKAKELAEKATADQKGVYEEQIQNLTLRLKQAEERKANAISMAQLTTKGHVYIISNIGSFGEDVFKIGLTRRFDPNERVRELSDAGVPFHFDVHALISHDEAPTVEAALHKELMLMNLNKLNPRKEFFKVSLKEIRSAVEKLGLNVNWTMTAAAYEYRQSLVIDKAIKEDPAKRAAWLAGQLEVGAFGVQMAASENQEEDDDAAIAAT
jgi:hypothetical protein